MLFPSHSVKNAEHVWLSVVCTSIHRKFHCIFEIAQILSVTQKVVLILISSFPDMAAA